MIALSVGLLGLLKSNSTPFRYAHWSRISAIQSTPKLDIRGRWDFKTVDCGTVYRLRVVRFHADGPKLTVGSATFELIVALGAF